MKTLWLTLIVVLVASCASSSVRAGAGKTCDGIVSFFHGDLNSYADAVDAASRDYQIEQWRVETATPGASLERMSKLFEKLQAVTYNKDIVVKTRLLDEASEGILPKDCPMRLELARARQLLDEEIVTDPVVIKKEKENQDLQDSLEKKNNAFRMKIPGEREPVSRALYAKKLASTENRKAREALYKEFNAARAKQWIAWGFKDLIRSRNAEGRAAGYRNYYDYRFFRNGLDLNNYRDMVAQVKRDLAPKMRALIAQMGKDAGIDKVEGWDLSYLREKSATGAINQWLASLPETTPLDVAKRFYSGLGISIDSYHFMMDLFPRPGKNTHAFAMGVVLPHVDWDGHLLPKPKPDIRFLANLKKPVKWQDISTVTHELGHAVHFAQIRQPVGIFRNAESVATEAIAMTMERMAGSPEFLKDTLPALVRIPGKDLEALARSHERAARIEQAFMLIRQVFFSDFEYEMYNNPDQDFAALWSKMHKEYWGVDVEPKDADWDVEHFVMAPVYVQNYAIGILMVEQLYESMLKDFGTSYHSTALGDKLKRVYFAPGEEFTYLDLTLHFTGKPLTADAAMHLVD